MEESKTHSNSHIPLVTRLDHLDFVMKSLEGKQDERQAISLDLAAREAYFKGSLMDRVAFLERRLFQLYLEMESSSRSSSQSSGSGSGSGCTCVSSSSKGTKSNINPNHAYHLQDYLAPNYMIPQPIKEKTHKEEARKDLEAKEQKSGKKKNNNSKKDSVNVNGEENVYKTSGIKKTPPKWPHIKILGC